MLLFLIRFIRGYVDFKATGKFPERFLNITASYGISILNPKPIKNGICASMNVNDYKKIRSIARKSRVKTKVLRRHGLPFLINRYKTRSGLFFGALTGIIAVLILSNFIWSVNITGTKQISNTYIQNVLAENGLFAGAYKNNIDVEKIERKVSVKIGKISWMSINITGNIANVELKEKAEKPEIDSSKKPCNIKSKCDGVITKIKASSGTTKVLKGSGVTKGDLLVSGINQTENGNIQYVRANAEVYADVAEKRQVTIKKHCDYYSIKENNIERNRLIFLWYELPCNMAFERYDYFIRTNTSKNLYINNVILPVGLKKQTTYELKKSDLTINKEKAEKILNNEILLYEVFAKSESTVVNRNIYLKENNDAYVFTINSIFNESIAEKVDFDVTE